MAETHCKKCGQLTEISDSKIVQQMMTKIIAQRDMLNALTKLVHYKTGVSQSLNRTIKQLLLLMTEEQQKEAKQIIAQPKRKIY